MTTQEEIRIRFGGDLTGISKATWTMLDGQKKAAMEYTAFWESAIAKREAAELASIEKIRAARMADATAQVEIARGSGAFGSLEAAAAGAGAGGAARGVAEVEHEAHGFAGILRELTVIGREGLRGNFTRMVGSVTILLGLLGGWAMAIGAATAAIAAYPAYLFYKANKVREDSDRSLDKTMEHDSSSLHSQIDELEKNGWISADMAKGYKEQLANGGYDNVSQVAGAIAQRRKNAIGKSPSKRISDADKLSGEEQKQLDERNRKTETQSSLESDIADKREKINFLQGSLNVLDKNSVEFHEAKARLLGYQLDLAKDLTDQGEQQKQQQEGQKDWKKWSDEAGRTYMKNAIGSAMEGAEFPTLEEMAGRSRVSRLNKDYGRGGRFDLGKGDGAFSNTAYDALLAQKQQVWDREHGNMGQANLDRQRYNADVKTLAENGAASPQMLLTRIEDNTAKLQTLFQTLVDNGVIIKGTE